MDRKLPRILAAIIIPASLLAAAGFLLYSLWLRGAFLPGWIEWNRDVRETLPEELSEKLDPSWLLQDARSFDLTGNGNSEEVLLIWKRGSYGRRKPTWVKKNDTGFSQHIFIYELRDGEYHPIWMSSALDFEVASMSEGKLIPGTDHSGPGRKSLCLKSPDGTESFWGWLSWGLRRI
ncbi:MAG: hypothetical protein K5985_11860 [Lachnospiraceae bacterium]|nr:hypothetical protein [Lachnospiraceae bacterium]